MEDNIHTNPEDSIRESWNNDTVTLADRIHEMAEEIRTGLRCSYLDGVAAGAEAVEVLKEEAEKEEVALTYKAWAVRNKNGHIVFHREMPWKEGIIWFSDLSEETRKRTDEAFPAVKWEDERPTPITVTIRIGHE